MDPFSMLVHARSSLASDQSSSNCICWALIKYAIRLHELLQSTRACWGSWFAISWLTNTMIGETWVFRIINLQQISQTGISHSGSPTRGWHVQTRGVVWDHKLAFPHFLNPKQKCEIYTVDSGIFWPSVSESLGRCTTRGTWQIKYTWDAVNPQYFEENPGANLCGPWEGLSFQLI